MNSKKQIIQPPYDNASELFPLVDASGQVVGCATRGECHGGSMLLHPVIHLHLFAPDGSLYLQKRPLWKDIQPGRWDTAVGGHVAFGETPDEALRREAREELGIGDFEATLVRTYEFRSDREQELICVYLTTFGGTVRPSDELDGGRFWTPDEIRAQIGCGVFTPNFEGEAKWVLDFWSI